jgi:glutamate 5-kinase
MSNLRRQILSQAKTVVVKVGTRLLTHEEGGFAPEQLQALVDNLGQILSNHKVVLVSSGAVGTGMGVLGFATKPKVLAEKQACAAVGQIRLMHAYDEAFAAKGIPVAQILLTGEDLRSPERFKNIRATVEALHAHGVLPIVNENDTVATAEIKVGDNDKLSADVCHFLGADLLIILSDIDGLFTDNPKTNPEAALIPVVQKVTPEIEALAGGTGSVASTGGMRTKVLAAKQVTRGGSACVIANGFKVSLSDILEGAAHGTLFLPAEKRMGAKKRWIAFVSKPAGKLLCDEGAIKAVVERRTSLLPMGIRKLEGKFTSGQVVDICNLEGIAVARGVAAYGAEELGAILGHKSGEITELLGHDGPEEAVHRDNLFVL